MFNGGDPLTRHAKRSPVRSRENRIKPMESGSPKMILLPWSIAVIRKNNGCMTGDSAHGKVLVVCTVSGQGYHQYYYLVFRISCIGK